MSRAARRRLLGLRESPGMSVDGCTASTPEAAIERYERAVRAGTAAIGAERFAALRGEFWGPFETRPYMRARLGLAQVLRGVRHLRLVTLLQGGMNDQAGALLSEHADDVQALWPYGRLLSRPSGPGRRRRGR